MEREEFAAAARRAGGDSGGRQTMTGDSAVQWMAAQGG